MIDDDLVIRTNAQGLAEFIHRHRQPGGSSGTQPSGTMADRVEILHAFVPAQHNVRGGAHRAGNQGRMPRCLIHRRVEKMPRRQRPGRPFSVHQHRLAAVEFLQRVVVHQII
ncbi:hypothetical protein D3C74_384250 [compost metagenome]